MKKPNIFVYKRQTPILEIPVTYKIFSGGEAHVQIEPEEVEKIKGSRVTVIACMDNPEDTLFLTFLLNALFLLKTSVFLEIPYFQYARQDRVCAVGQAFTLDIFVGILNQISRDNASLTYGIRVWDVHSNITIELLNNTSFNYYIDNVRAYEFIKQSTLLDVIKSDDSTLMVSPDHGAVVRTKQLCNAIYNEHGIDRTILYGNKVRNPVNGYIDSMELDKSHDGLDLTGKTCVITDDLCDGGMTFILLAKTLKARGAVKVYLYVTHGIFSKGLDVFDGLIDHIWTTNSKWNAPDPRLTIINGFDSRYNIDRKPQE